jgi:ribosomal protein S18 acetylase RimI-like enzyme
VKVTLRTHTPEDFETLYEIDRACYPEEIAYSRRELHSYLRLPGAECVVAEEAGKIIGFCLSAHAGTRGHIITIDVLEEHRRHGLGSELLTEVENRLGAQGVREMSRETATENESAIAFWQKHGYRNQGVIKRYYPGGRDAFAMRKSIAPSAAAANEGR